VLKRAPRQHVRFGYETKTLSSAANLKKVIGTLRA
jgi:hypothetical protein